MKAHSIKLPDEVSAKIEELVAELGQSKSDIFREAIESYLNQRSGQGYSFSRIAEISEYLQVAIQDHLFGNDEAKHDKVLDVVDQRLIDHHGR